MTVYLCVDEDMGVAFNGRRQSRDSAVISKIWEMSEGRVTCSAYSARLFEKYGDVDTEAELEKTAADAHWFSELDGLAGRENEIDKLVIFRWNRKYPHDVTLGLSLKKLKLTDTFEFRGTSHDNITCEVWTR